jgi:2'-5' RNA ligase
VAVRTFVALELSERTRTGILAVVEELRGRGIRASWCRPGTIHLTLKFLGDVDETELPAVVAAVARAARSVSCFTLETRSLGAFPSPARPRVLWMGVEAPAELFDLARAIENELADLGFPREKRRFHPHITLGRIRDGRAGSILELLEELTTPREKTDVTEVRIMKSTLRPQGALHEVVEAVPLFSETAE